MRVAYNHARYVDERRELMQRWADYLDAVRQPGTAGNVLRLRRKRAA